MTVPYHHLEKVTSGINSSVWLKTCPAIQYGKLDRNITCDVAIVGGGISGVTIAYCLSRSGKKVVLVEDGYLGSGETGRTTAHLTTALDDRYYKLERMYGKDETRLLAESHSAAIDFVEKTVGLEQIHCQFKRIDGYLFLHPSDKQQSLTDEFSAATEAGMDVQMMEKIPGIKNVEGSCLRFNNQAQLHPLLYLKGLADAAIRSGAEIFTETHAKEIDGSGIITDDHFKVDASYVVVATNTPVNNLLMMHFNQTPFRTYVIGATIKKGKLKDALWWDTGDFGVNKNVPPYHYVRIEPFNELFDLLIVGGEDHETGSAGAEDIPEEKRYAVLEEWARRHFAVGAVVYQWSGQVMEPLNGIAYIGRNPLDKKNVYIVTGDSGNGMTHGTIAGMLITDQINGKKNAWEELYNPSRMVNLKPVVALFSEFVGSIKSYFESGEEDALSDTYKKLKPGEGRIVMYDGKKFGCYFDEDEFLHLVNAECTHLKCTVQWNNDEKSWDCPCHGSRFSYEGAVLNGPANKPLDYQKIETPVHR